MQKKKKKKGFNLTFCKVLQGHCIFPMFYMFYTAEVDLLLPVIRNSPKVHDTTEAHFFPKAKLEFAEGWSHSDFIPKKEKRHFFCGVFCKNE